MATDGGERVKEAFTDYCEARGDVFRLKSAIGALQNLSEEARLSSLFMTALKATLDSRKESAKQSGERYRWLTGKKIVGFTLD